MLSGTIAGGSRHVDVVDHKWTYGNARPPGHQSLVDSPQMSQPQIAARTSTYLVSSGLKRPRRKKSQYIGYSLYQESRSTVNALHNRDPLRMTCPSHRNSSYGSILAKYFSRCPLTSRRYTCPFVLWPISCIVYSLTSPFSF